jgi:hypothetical protein
MFTEKMEIVGSSDKIRHLQKYMIFHIPESDNFGTNRRERFQISRYMLSYKGVGNTQQLGASFVFVISHTNTVIKDNDNIMQNCQA